MLKTPSNENWYPHTHAHTTTGACVPLEFWKGILSRTHVPCGLFAHSTAPLPSPQASILLFGLFIGGNGDFPSIRILPFYAHRTCITTAYGMHTDSEVVKLSCQMLQPLLPSREVQYGTVTLRHPTQHDVVGAAVCSVLHHFFVFVFFSFSSPSFPDPAPDDNIDRPLDTRLTTSSARHVVLCARITGTCCCSSLWITAMLSSNTQHMWTLAKATTEHSPSHHQPS